MPEAKSPSTFMIEYVTRFKVKYEKEVAELERRPLEEPVYQVMQLGRARRVVQSANIILEMGPNAMQENHERFERVRAIMFSNNAAFCNTERLIRERNSHTQQILARAKVIESRTDRRR